MPCGLIRQDSHHRTSRHDQHPDRQQGSLVSGHAGIVTRRSAAVNRIGRIHKSASPSAEYHDNDRRQAPTEPITSSQGGHHMSRRTSRLWDFIEGNWFWIMLFGVPGIGAATGRFASWSPTEITTLAGILAITLVCLTALTFWKRVRVAQAEAAVTQAMLQRELTVEEMERLQRASTTWGQETEGEGTEDEETQQLGELVNQLAVQGVSDPVTEQVLVAFRGAETRTRRQLAHTLITLAENGNASNERVQVIVRSLGQQKANTANGVPLDHAISATSLQSNP